MENCASERQREAVWKAVLQALTVGRYGTHVWALSGPPADTFTVNHGAALMLCMSSRFLEANAAVRRNVSA